MIGKYSKKSNEGLETISKTIFFEKKKSLSKILMSLTTVPDISKITSIGLRDKTEPVAEVIYWPDATPAPAHLCSSLCSTRVTKSRTTPLALFLTKHLLIESCGCYWYTMKAGVVHCSSFSTPLVHCVSFWWSIKCSLWFLFWGYL